MRYMSSNEIRSMWLNYFKSKGHHVEEGASLVPVNDPTLLWINAGVAALKKYFDGSVIPDNPRICNVQKAIRTNDIENVGHTARHHTFFEMMGNFSIGDYFRNEAIEFGFELLTSPNYFAIPTDKLYITYFPDDKETYNKWISLGMSPDHMVRCEGNFWEIGEGPCGPDTEIFFDRGEQYDPNHIGPRMIEDDIENDRYIEIWNIVFSQFNSKPGKARSEYPELPHKNIDTGAGLERFCLIMQGADTNYETDLFMPIIKATEKLTSIKYENEYKTSFKIIADHLRTCTFALADGATFSNEGRGYVLRRLLRRAARHGRKLGIDHAFLSSLIDVVIDNMNAFYPYLNEKREYIKNLITIEENKFLEKLADGEKKLNDLYNKNKKISGQDAFVLYDTYGFPFEITLEFAEEHGLSINKAEFDAAMNEQKEKARNSRSNKGSMKSQNELFMDFKEESLFVGYEKLTITSKVIGVFKEDDHIGIVTKETPFYGEMGGEIGDVGVISKEGADFEVFDTIKMPNGQCLMKCHALTGSLSVGDEVTLQVNDYLRDKISANHSATHLLDASLKVVLGNHVYQHGSQVTDSYLRFDFNHINNVTPDDLLKIEDLVNSKIDEGIQVVTYELPIEDAKKEGAVAVFGEKYGNIVRIVKIGDFSKEFCGGCHTFNTKNISHFAISSIESKGSGIYRIEAVSGIDLIDNLISRNATLFDEYQQFVDKYNEILIKVNELNINKIDINLDVNKIPSYRYLIGIRNKINEIKDVIKAYDKEIKNKEAMNNISSFDIDSVPHFTVNGNDLIFVTLNLDDGAIVKQIADNIQNKYQNSIIFVMSVTDKIVFVAKCSPEHNKKGIMCGNLVKQAAMLTGGNGGGRPDFAQAGGKDVSKASEVFDLIKSLL